jgi:hypothetical protein
VSVKSGRGYNYEQRANSSTYGLGKTASIGVHVDISFGLTIAASVAVLVKTAKETIMGYSSGLVLSVWCGAAFLRSHGGKISAQTRDRYVPRAMLPRVNAEGSTPSLRTYLGG